MKLTDNQREALGDAYRASGRGCNVIALAHQIPSCNALVRRGLLRKLSKYTFRITAEGRKFIEEGR